MRCRFLVLSAFLSAALLLDSCRSEERFRDGDALFVPSAGSSFDNAITDATASGDVSFTHVGFHYDGYVYEAVPSLGVVKTPLEKFLKDNDGVVSVAIEGVDIKASVALMESHIGEPYDYLYMPRNGRMYCSELLQTCVVDKDGNQLLPCIEMNFLAPDGTLPDFWRDLFESEGVDVPQGCPGTNPTQLYLFLTSSERARALLEKMTLDEKIGQLIIPYGWPMYERLSDSTATYSPAFKDFIDNNHGGMLWGLFRADPWTEKTLENGLNPRSAISACNALQHYAVDSTRLGIPILLAEEAPHGHMAIGTTVFPTGIGLAATWDTELMYEVGRAMREELSAVGARISYGPVVDLARDLRWSRVEETFGEDPFLTSRLAGAIVRGMAPKSSGWDRGVVATLKHFIAYGAPQGGHNGNVSVVGPRDMAENMLPVFKYVLDQGALSVMTSYNSVDGVPCTSNSALLRDVLRTQWGFDGVVVSDLYAIDGLKGTHRVVDSALDAAELALQAGVDLDLGANCYPRLKQSVEQGRISESDLDEAVLRVLELKYRLGLFDRPYINEDGYKAVRSRQHGKTALQAARESVVLLENNGILPLRKGLKLAVIGPNADRMYNQLGDYTAPQPDSSITTPLEGLRNKFGESNVTYVHGCSIRDTLRENISRAVEEARRSDVVVVFVGGSSARDFGTVYADTGAALTDAQTLSDMDSGEGFDRSSLELLGLQPRLLHALKAAGKPLVVVYIEGRPLDKRWAKSNADALLTQFYPGQAGGEAIADVLLGDYNPAGRLPVSVPYCTGQLPVHYNQPFGQRGDYIDMPAEPLYSFGYGLSYTSFSYENMVCEVNGGSVDVSVDVTNTGCVDGEEVVQLYVTDLVASTVRPSQQLKAFERVMVRSGQTVNVRFTLGMDAFAVCDQSLRPVVEPGDFLIKLGSSSDRILLQEKITLSSSRL